MFIPNKTYIVRSMIYSLKWPLLQYFNTIHSYIHTWLYLLWGNCMQTLLLIGKYSNRHACTRQKKCETQLGNACCSILCGFLSLWSVLRVTCVGSTHFCFWLCVFVAWLVHICSTCFQTDEDVSLICFFLFFFPCCLKWRWVELSSPPCKLPFSILITRAHKQNMKSWKQSTESSVWNECDLQLQRSNVQRQRHRKQRLLSESSAISLACLRNMFPRFCVDVKLLCLLSGWY